MNVKSLWVSGPLSRLEQTCLLSWINVGYTFDLYVYEEPAHLPHGVRLLDAREILPEHKIFKYKLPLSKGGGSYSGFSNFFRYKLLCDKGGVWVDTDMFCLKPLPETEYLFAREFDNPVASCIIKSPPASEFAEFCWDYCQHSDPERLVWGQTGPALVTRAIQKCDLNEYIQQRERFFPIMYTDVDAFLQDRFIPSDAYTIHFWNEMWRRLGMNKNVVYNQNTLYERLVATSICPRLI